MLYDVLQVMAPRVGSPLCFNTFEGLAVETYKMYASFPDQPNVRQVSLQVSPMSVPQPSKPLLTSPPCTVTCCVICCVCMLLQWAVALRMWSALAEVLEMPAAAAAAAAAAATAAAAGCGTVLATFFPASAPISSCFTHSWIVKDIVQRLPLEREGRASRGAGAAVDQSNIRSNIWSNIWSTRSNCWSNTLPHVGSSFGQRSGGWAAA